MGRRPEAIGRIQSGRPHAGVADKVMDAERELMWDVRGRAYSGQVGRRLHE